MQQRWSPFLLCMQVLLAAVIVLLRPVPATAEADRSTNWVQADGAVVATAHPEASQIGVDMLNKGGNAVDAAIAAAYAIGVFEPTGSGIGGGGSATIYIAEDSSWHYVDFYQSAPQDPVTDFDRSSDLPGPKAVHIPGLVAGLEHMRGEWAQLERRAHLQPSIDAARDGFVPGPVLLNIIRGQTSKMSVFAESRELFTNDGEPLEEGDVLRNPRLADAMDMIADQGADVFYEGALADTLVARLNRYGGRFESADFCDYQVFTPEPIHTTYHGYDIYSAPPPQSGITILQALNMMEAAEMDSHGHYSDDVLPLHLLVETLKRAFADRTAYLADPGFASVPVNGLISKDFAQTRFDDINPEEADPADPRETGHGNPWAYADARRLIGPPPTNVPTLARAAPTPASPFGEAPNPSGPALALADSESAENTSHISVIDSEGNMVSLTTTIGLFFGSGVTVHGIPLNSSRTLFGASPNQAEPGKRGRSTIAPTLIARDGAPFAAVGAAGAARIIPAILLGIHNVIDHGMDAWEAVEAPRFLARRAHDRHEFESRISSFVIQDLIRMGHPVRVRQSMEFYFGGMQLALAHPGEPLEASSDPRRDGRPAGTDRRITSAGNGGFQDTLPGSGDDGSDDAGASFVLHSGYPNPFNDRTVIRFELREPGRVHLGIYNTLGRRVKRPLSGQELQAGMHNVPVDMSGHASGVYLFRLTHRDMQQSKPMLLVK